MSPASPIVVETTGLSRRYGPRVALEDFTCAIAAGEAVVVLGPNGAGKTTTLRLLAGLITPTSGSGTVAGISLIDGPLDRIRSRVGLLTETPGLWDRLSVWTNLLTHARLHGLADAAGRVRAVLDELRLADRRDDLTAELSKGLRQRVAIARALLHRPAVLLLDEPTSGLDPAAAKDVRQVIGRLRREGAAVLVCTHNLAEAEGLADRVAVLKTRLLAVDTPEGLRRRLGADRPPVVAIDVEGDAAAWCGALAPLSTSLDASGSTLRLSLSTSVAVPDAVAALVTAGARVVSVREERRSLEDAYLDLVGRNG